MQKKVFLWIAVVTGGLLLISLIAMQFTNQVVWSLSDFAIAGILIFGSGSILALTIKKFPKHKTIIIVTIVIAFLWLWAELAVGIFTNWGS